MRKDCIFCKIAKKEIPADIIFENNNILVILDRDWAVKGHTLVIWKKHKNNFSDLSKRECSKFSEIVRKTEKALLVTLNVDRSVILKSGSIVPHFHFHIYPIPQNTPWEFIKKMIEQEEKETKYRASQEEKEEFTNHLVSKIRKIR